MIYRFEDCELDTVQFELRRGGVAVETQPQVFELLRYLIERRERMVSKDELFSEIWSGRIVSDAALSSRIKAARHAIGDDGTAQRLIRTVHGRGFRFVGEVEGDADAPGPATPAAEAKFADGSPALREPSVAVLPFTNLSGDPSQEYFSDGITEDIITELSKYRSFLVVARNSSFSFKGRDVTPRQIAAELGVRYILQGSIRRSADRIRITCQLTDAQQGTQIWGSRFEGELSDIFDLQDEISSSIAGAVEPEIAVAEVDRVRRAVPENMVAWDYLQRGKWHLWHYTPEDGLKAQGFFERAIAIEPDLSAAHSGLSLTLCHQALFAWEEDQAAILSRAKQAANNAMTLDPRDAFGFYCMGRACTLTGEHDAALTALERALELNPNFALTYFGLAFTLVWFGRAEEALPHLEKVIRLSPNDPIKWSFEMIKGAALWWLGQFGEAVSVLGRARRHPNADFWPFAAAAVAYIDMGNQTAAKEAIEELKTKRPDVTLKVIDRAFANAASDLRIRFLENLKSAGMPST